MSHTGSMSGNSRLFDAMTKTTGIIKTDYVKEFLDLAGVLSKGIYPKGKRIGIITNSGGPGALIATNAEKIGLEIPEFSETLQKTLKSMVPPTGSYKNPIDVTFDMDMFNFYSKMPKVLMKSGEVDLIIIYGVIGFHYLISNYTKNEKLAPYVEINHELFEKIESLEDLLIKPVLKASKRFSIPIFYINPENLNSQWSRKMRESGAILFQYWDAPVNCAQKLCKYAEYRRNHSQ